MSHLPHFTPEQKVLLYCARSQFLDPYPAKVKQLAEKGINWKTVVDLSETHKLTQLLYQNLKTGCREFVPDEILSRLQNIYAYQVQFILYLTGELVSLVKDFSAMGIPALPYKGPVLATQVYGNLALRPFIDLDILVPVDKIDPAKKLLLDKGYRISWPEIPLSEVQERAHIRSKYNYQFFQSDRNITLELHWGVMPRYFAFPSSPAWLWQDLHTIPLAGTPILA
ncbi:MAG: nucleotidyltransferase family protein, partial [Anaerolineales bacterium]